MKVKTSVSLSAELLRELDELVGEGLNRSAVLEAAASEWVRRRRRAAEFDAEVARLDRITAGDEPADLLAYSVDPATLGDAFEFDE